MNMVMVSYIFLGLNSHTQEASISPCSYPEDFRASPTSCSMEGMTCNILYTHVLIYTQEYTHSQTTCIVFFMYFWGLLNCRLFTDELV